MVRKPLTVETRTINGLNTTKYDHVSQNGASTWFESDYAKLIRNFIDFFEEYFFKMFKLGLHKFSASYGHGKQYGADPAVGNACEVEKGPQKYRPLVGWGFRTAQWKGSI